MCSGRSIVNNSRVDQSDVTSVNSLCALRTLSRIAQVFEYSEESKEQLEEAAAGDKGILQSILEVFGCSDKSDSSKKQQ